MKTFVDPDLCIGCGLCPDISEIYSMNDDDLAVAKDIEIPDEMVDEVNDAVTSCPVDAIKVE